ncbi:MAG: hypothetical protein J7496_13660 [Novosphingobium sp.]|nr:hypothetical protein [Novosphingobium sp.]MBO9603544.1 hypothetical protein [Novosphingobium sp.]
MLRGYRRFFVALAGLVLAAAHQPKEHAQTDSRAQQEQGAPAPIASPSPPAEAPYRPYPNYSPDPCYSAQNHDAADLCAQWRAAIAAEKAAQEAGRATSWGIFATFLSLATVLGLIYSLWQTSGALSEARRGNLIAAKGAARSTRRAIASAKETEAALEIARQNAKAAELNADATERAIAENQRIGEAQTRAYLTIRNASMSPAIAEPGFLLTFDLVNTGNSPAIKLTLKYQVRWMQGTSLAESTLIERKQFVNDVSAKQTEAVEDFVRDEALARFFPNQYQTLECAWVELKVTGEDVFGKEVETISHWARFWRGVESRSLNGNLSPTNTAMVLRAGEMIPRDK